MPTTMSGQITVLRVNEVGDSVGKPGDAINAEVIVTLSSHPPGVFSGFQLRNDANQPVRQGMLDLLRDAFTNGWTANFDEEIPPGKTIGTIIRVWITKPVLAHLPGGVATHLSDKPLA
jgi:hypothetical protein